MGGKGGKGVRLGGGSQYCLIINCREYVNKLLLSHSFAWSKANPEGFCLIRIIISEKEIELLPQTLMF